MVYKKQGDALTLESAAFNGGRFVRFVIAGRQVYVPNYFIADHLGSVRMVLDGEQNVLERNDYYPFGMRWNNAATQISDNRYRYNGKEDQGFLKLPYIDYGARQFDPLTGRWFNIDQLLEKMRESSPYAFCGNNPIVRVDSDGRIWDTVWDVVNLTYDVGAATYNHIVGDHETAKSHWTDAGLDLAATLIPFVPAGATKVLKAADKAADVVKAADKVVDTAKAADKAADATKATKRGLDAEKRVLKDMGLDKNTARKASRDPITNVETTTIPDAVDAKTVYEVKDAKSVYNTKQIRAERRVAEEAGKQFKVVTGQNTHVSKNILPQELIRRNDLGPR